MIGLPCVAADAVHVTPADRLWGAAVTEAGAEGTGAGVTALVGADGVPAPWPLVAVTVKL